MQKFLRYHLRRDDLTPFDILAPDAPRFFWKEPSSGSAWAGNGIIAHLTGSGAERFQKIKREADEVLSRVEDLNTAPVPNRLFGGFSFSPTINPGEWNDFAAAEFILPHLQINQINGQTWLTVCRRAEPGITRETLAAEAHAVRPIWDAPVAELLHLSDETSFEAWTTMVKHAVRDIRNEKMCKVVLARTRRAQFDRALDVLPGLKTLVQNYPDTFRFLFSPRSNKTFFGATPELLVRVEGGELFSVALAGSVERGKTLMEDETLATDLLRSAKDRHEHALVVGAIRHELEKLTTRLDIPATPIIRRLANIQHLETPIRGLLSNNHSVLDALEALHPTPALGGVPLEPALNFIAGHEPATRGWYAAPIGWLDANGNGTFAVAIRSALVYENKALLFAGAGIVDGSEPAKEWQEIEMKFEPLTDALTHPTTINLPQTLSLAQT